MAGEAHEKILLYILCICSYYMDEKYEMEKTSTYNKPLPDLVPT